MEKVWDDVSGRVNRWFDNRKLKRYRAMAAKMYPRIHDYLNSKGIKHAMFVGDDSEGRWIKVDIRVFVDMPTYKDVLRLWDDVCKIAYAGLGHDKVGVMVSLAPMDVYERKRRNRGGD